VSSPWSTYELGTILVPRCSHQKDVGRFWFLFPGLGVSFQNHLEVSRFWTRICHELLTQTGIDARCTEPLANPTDCAS